MAHDLSDHDNFKPGEEVMFTLPRTYSERRGVVRKVSHARVTVVEPNGETTVLHRSNCGAPFRCRRITAQDVARDTWLSEMTAWESACPVLRHLGLSQWVRHGAYTVHGLSVEATLDALEQIAAEAYAIREWLRKRPEGPR